MRILNYDYRREEQADGAAFYALAVYDTIRNSFLLSFAVLGVFISVAGAVLAFLGHGEPGGILGASGFVVFVVNIVMYLAFMVVRQYY